MEWILKRSLINSDIILFMFVILGGLLIILPRDRAENFCADIERVDGQPAWVIGYVEHGNRTARIAEEMEVIEVPEIEQAHEFV